MKKRKQQRAEGVSRPDREPYEPPKIHFTEIQAQEALMAICKLPGPPCMPMKGGGS
jgi:hypothetical protein